MRTFIAGLTLLLWAVASAAEDGRLPASTSHPESASCIWFADENAIHRVDTTDNRISLSIPFRDPLRLLMNGEDCGVWAHRYPTHRLLRYDARGNLEREVALKQLSPRLNDVDRSAIDAADGSLWISDERNLAHIDASGALQGLIPLPGKLLDIQVALDRTLWILTGHQLQHLRQDGGLLDVVGLDALLHHPQRIWVDSLNDIVWVAGNSRLIQLDRRHPQQPPARTIKLPDKIVAGALNPRRGEIWLATKHSLYAIDTNGIVARTIPLAPLGLRDPEKMAIDPVSRSLWVGFQRRIARFDEQGELVASLLARDGDEALGVPAFRVIPAISILRPTADELTNNPTPHFQIGYDAQCNGRPCGFAESAYASYRLSATVNATEVGDRFAFDPVTGSSTYTPITRLPEGPNRLSALVTDRFGTTSASRSIGFTVDTIPPRFIELAPANGSVLTQPAVTIQGKADPSSVVFMNKDELNGQGANPQNTTFAWPATLKPGANTARLSAVDLAGNSTEQTLSLTYMPPGIDFTIESPGAGAAIGSDSVLVSGSFTATGVVGISVNGIAAALTNNRFSAVVPLHPGGNNIVVSASTPDGFKTTKTLAVTAADSPVKIGISPNPVIAGVPVTFSVGTAATITGIEADYNGDGVVDQTASSAAALAYAYPAPGTYQAAFKISDGQNQVINKSAIVIVQDIRSIDGQIQAVYQSVLSRLKQRDIPGASTYFTAGAAEKYSAVFSELGENLPVAANSLGSLAEGSIGDGLAEYLIVRDTPQGRVGFLIYFLQGEDGLWRIGAM